ncbi:hypothetical protein [Caballeronia sp. INDeC2]|uniref:hypothetical protein n=1 Tax=Caballeronia sp. INDeC2 TaxID=2921747 RepID=UPI0032EDAA79
MRHFLIVAAAAALTLCSNSAFAGWARGGTAYTGRGEYQGAHVGSCGGGSCSHAGGVENPWGRVATNSGTVTRTSPGQFANSGTAYGPNGRSVQHAGDTSCADGSCTHNGSATGPNGKTATGSDTVTRTAPGQYSSSGSVTGPNGNTSTHSASTNCAGYTCNRSGTAETSNGGTVTHSGSATSVAPGVVTTTGTATVTNGSHSTTVAGGGTVTSSTTVVAATPVVTGTTVVAAPVIVPPPPPPSTAVVVATPAPAPVKTVYVVPHRAVLIPGHWVGRFWVPAHWA